ncbi:SRPBCC family protein [Actinoalloteichus hymeniacidonis]|uniref:Polyketide cyclase / dehydrase family protein n=1 Tax=Actinoalloteichus hymeniacidonis TaxID=340345 RepID=A0AAC9MZV0_9PSEU|nr:SRPBCC family protein [Actinoalloteichus hymeniacidonis]AOS64859.1 polyketide cyclase / dehydrase family protein [Actinoalloteichus hymeniacidonis]MBB5907066.1 hypothetical protein [Actinoalloteichus hymeniacidonis]
MAIIDRSVNVPVPAATAYRWWAAPERLAKLLPEVDEAVSLDADRSRWQVSFGAADQATWDIRVHSRHPARELRWQSVAGEPEHAGIVTFEPIDEERCVLRVRAVWRPRSTPEHVTRFLGIVDHWAQAALAESARRLAEQAAGGSIDRHSGGEPEPVWPTENDVPTARPAEHALPRIESPAEAMPGTPGTPLGPTPPFTDPRYRPGN